MCILKDCYVCGNPFLFALRFYVCAVFLWVMENLRSCKRS